jgi:hypothetical protein
VSGIFLSIISLKDILLKRKVLESGEKLDKTHSQSIFLQCSLSLLFTLPENQK